MWCPTSRLPCALPTTWIANCALGSVLKVVSAYVTHGPLCCARCIVLTTASAVSSKADAELYPLRYVFP